jgi:hypothetical protein
MVAELRGFSGGVGGELLLVVLEELLAVVLEDNCLRHG